MGNQISRPQQGEKPTYPDAGGYDANEWAWLYRLLFTTDPTTQGVVPSFESELAVTNPAGSTIRMASGAALVQGHGYMNHNALTPSSASNVDFLVAAPTGSATRDDIVVLVQNNTDLDYSTNLAFPTDLTDYGGTLSVPPHSCRVAILTGDETASGVARSPVQNVGVAGNIWMLPIYTYTIDNVGAITALEDVRGWVSVGTAYTTKRQAFAPITYGYDATGGSEVTVDTLSFAGGYYVPQIFMDDAIVTRAVGTFNKPLDYYGDGILYAMVRSGNSGQIAYALRATGGDVGSAMDTEQNDSGVTLLSLTAGELTAIPLTLTNFGDVMGVTFLRDGTNVSDTLTLGLHVFGFYLEYTALEQ